MVGLSASTLIPVIIAQSGRSTDSGSGGRFPMADRFHLLIEGSSSPIAHEASAETSNEPVALRPRSFHRQTDSMPESTLATNACDFCYPAQFSFCGGKSMPYSYVVLGSGRQTTASAYDLGKFGNARKITLADADLARAQSAADWVN